ncbi:hypothetical protein CNYM01_01700 [Colletotrichum nymphaeae SA-01]|uniref:Protein kinase domain-containing protein n=1 Tax=Colletotrichum nymphaeae SA-01 TaxID=1460502 RepID=A0A135TWW6_9PEZI|nr:hypothetical protein CNYM01_01700 [Colletotrichum nymphaeae SA-01]
MDGQQESEDLAVEMLKKLIKNLPANVYAIKVSPEGSLISMSNDPEDDETFCVYYPPLEEVQRPEAIRTVIRSELKEIDWLGPDTDLVSYQPHPNDNEPKKVVFKYYFIFQFIQRVWNELNVWMRLPRHPNIVPFDRLVVDELKGRVVGFTSVYIPGGTLEYNQSRVFKLRWFEQLTEVVDSIRRQTACSSLTSNFSGRIGGPCCIENRNDINGVIFTLYEIITRDDHFRHVPHEEQNPDDVQGLSTWPKHPEVQLDHPVSEYRSYLNRWVKKRREEKGISVYTEAPEPIDWPPLQTPRREYTAVDKEGNETVQLETNWSRLRRNERKEGNITLEWQRPPRNKVLRDDRG